MKNNIPYHNGEIEVQRLAGEQDKAKLMARLIQKTIIPAAFDFIQQQSVIWIGVQDPEKFHWAFPLFGSPGFISSNDDGSILEIYLNNMTVIPDEWRNYLITGNVIGCLVIEFASRRRIRINGVIKEINKNSLKIHVQQSFNNCPNHIRRRTLSGTTERSAITKQTQGSALNETIKDIIARADTAFVSSSGPNGFDVSHRAGETGFIKAVSPNKIMMPDYKGNSMFMTLGNFTINPQGGLLVVDFDQGYYLQLCGAISVFINNERLSINGGETNRYWELTIHKWQLFKMDNSLKWQSCDV